ncbi:hypothetical protein Pmar_PMAR020858 [Perkinsus marinus ATCC 50983]|uniref:Uncharacterized protein n=1 Tax=Perkinsus marinus (strain ATCC 50983 / TXsc) TaxID=423536 RepID=C5KN43_PERM5|nr:hypothetical protein Pmar_PMAR020858 [Perkinsus marinus ATCC 50983]EER14077.1 hypothetical protein Pmar_PMAR020858 [Perkinsus marinus ATCC 50983]|eukprot:XP_002782282.1 hypothetical protein Pmar_PMAR020858 [Perkinsus marinus ATCC 50983]
MYHVIVESTGRRRSSVLHCRRALGRVGIRVERSCHADTIIALYRAMLALVRVVLTTLKSLGRRDALVVKLLRLLGRPRGSRALTLSLRVGRFVVNLWRAVICARENVTTVHVTMRSARLW